MTTELVWSTVKPTFEEILGKKIYLHWKGVNNTKAEDTCEETILSLETYNRAFNDGTFYRYATLDLSDLTAPVSPLPLWGVEAKSSLGGQGYYVKFRSNDESDKSWILETPMLPTEELAILAWNRIAEALKGVER